MKLVDLNKNLLSNFQELIPKKVNFVIGYLVQESVEVEEDFVTFKLNGNGNLKIKTKYPIHFKVHPEIKRWYKNSSSNYIEIVKEFEEKSKALKFEAILIKNLSNEVFNIYHKILNETIT